MWQNEQKMNAHIECNTVATLLLLVILVIGSWSHFLHK